MKKQILFALVLISLSACNPFRQVLKTNSKIKTTEISVEEKDLSTQTNVKDKSIVTTTTTSKKTIERPAFKGEQATPLPSNLIEALKRGLTVYRDSMISVRMQLDSATNQLNTFVESKGGTTTDETTTQTTEKKDINKQENTQEKKVAKHQKKQAEQLKTTEKAPIKIPWIPILSVSLVLAFIYFSYRKIKK